MGLWILVWFELLSGYFFWKGLLTRLTIYSLCILLIVLFLLFPFFNFAFEGGVQVLIPLVSVHCLLFFLAKYLPGVDLYA